MRAGGTGLLMCGMCVNWVGPASTIPLVFSRRSAIRSALVLSPVSWHFLIAGTLLVHLLIICGYGTLQRLMSQTLLERQRAGYRLKLSLATTVVISLRCSSTLEQDFWLARAAIVAGTVTLHGQSSFTISKKTNFRFIDLFQWFYLAVQSKTLSSCCDILLAPKIK